MSWDSNQGHKAWEENALTTFLTVRLKSNHTEIKTKSLNIQYVCNNRFIYSSDYQTRIKKTLLILSHNI